MINPAEIERPHNQDIILSSKGDMLIESRGEFGLKIDSSKYGLVLIIAAPRYTRITTQRIIDNNGLKPFIPPRYGLNEVGLLEISFLKNPGNRTIYIGRGYEHLLQYSPDGKQDSDDEYPFSLSTTRPISLTPVSRIQEMKSFLEDFRREKS